MAYIAMEVVKMPNNVRLDSPLGSDDDGGIGSAIYVGDGILLTAGHVYVSVVR